MIQPIAAEINIIEVVFNGSSFRVTTTWWGVALIATLLILWPLLSTSRFRSVLAGLRGLIDMALSKWDTAPDNSRDLKNK